jgi:hypothetical protein
MTDGPPPDLPPGLPVGPPPLPGVPDPDEPDWLIEDGLYVATRSGLLRRGYCCGSGCRNCPWKDLARRRAAGEE